MGAFNAATPDGVRRELLACCASTRWADALAAGRPYPDLAALCAASNAVLAGLDWPDVEHALAAHPRIGERAAGQGREARWSRGEQAAAASTDAAVQAELADGNAEYERRFGQVFLICATGLPAETILAALRARLAHDEPTEHRVVREELGKIIRLRLTKLVAE
ncbi:MAG TPA: 2-oxo-4-hydroxy-4-carboxy-5-ureidoimidazoline decarboxylase [Mycobacteriales bacterium]|nr:2-oxo-4-hydroxy-4-carboxy-5-ureidoimidazoline decarboxylase [Mycobacteriales bacterium]